MSVQKKEAKVRVRTDDGVRGVQPVSPPLVSRRTRPIRSRGETAAAAATAGFDRLASRLVEPRNRVIRGLLDAWVIVLATPAQDCDHLHRLLE